MTALHVILGFVGVGTVLVVVRSVIAWFRNSASERRRAEFTEVVDKLDREDAASKTAGDILRAKAVAEAGRILNTLPDEPDDDEAERLLAEARERLKRARR